MQTLQIAALSLLSSPLALSVGLFLERWNQLLTQTHTRSRVDAAAALACPGVTLGIVAIV